MHHPTHTNYTPSQYPPSITLNNIFFTLTPGGRQTTGPAHLEKMWPSATQSIPFDKPYSSWSPPQSHKYQGHPQRVNEDLRPREQTQSVEDTQLVSGEKHLPVHLVTLSLCSLLILQPADVPTFHGTICFGLG